MDTMGKYSHIAQWLLAELSWYRGRWNGTIVKPSLVTAPACTSVRSLIGTIRDCKGGRRQKMVDTLLSVDAQYFAREQRLSILIASDDDDLVPVALAARSLDNPPLVCLARKRLVGQALNDSALTHSGVKLLTF